MLTFKEYMKLDEAGIVDPLSQVGGNYGKQINNPYWAYGGRWGKLATADLTRHDQMLYHVARLLTEVEKLVFHRQKMSGDIPYFHQDLLREFSQQNIELLVQLSVLKIVPPNNLMPQIQQLAASGQMDGQMVQAMLPKIQAGDPAAVAYLVDERKLQELQSEIMRAQNDDKLRHYLGSMFDNLMNHAVNLATTTRLQLNPAISQR
jgi:hypothetical protein